MKKQFLVAFVTALLFSFNSCNKEENFLTPNKELQTKGGYGDAQALPIGGGGEKGFGDFPTPIYVRPLKHSNAKDKSNLPTFSVHDITLSLNGSNVTDNSTFTIVGTPPIDNPSSFGSTSIGVRVSPVYRNIYSGAERLGRPYGRRAITANYGNGHLGVSLHSLFTIQQVNATGSAHDLNSMTDSGTGNDLDLQLVGYRVRVEAPTKYQHYNYVDGLTNYIDLGTGQTGYFDGHELRRLEDLHNENENYLHISKFNYKDKELKLWSSFKRQYTIIEARIVYIAHYSATGGKFSTELKYLQKAKIGVLAGSRYYSINIPSNIPTSAYHMGIKLKMNSIFVRIVPNEKFDVSKSFLKSSAL